MKTKMRYETVNYEAGTLKDTAGLGAQTGCALGVLGGAVAIVVGGYELGSAINDAIGVSNTIGRGALDLITIGAVAKYVGVYVIGAGMISGGAAGGLIGTIAHPIIKGSKGLGSLVSKGYKQLRGKQENILSE